MYIFNKYIKYKYYLYTRASSNTLNRVPLALAKIPRVGRITCVTSLDSFAFAPSFRSLLCHSGTDEDLRPQNTSMHLPKRSLLKKKSSFQPNPNPCFTTLRNSPPLFVKRRDRINFSVLCKSVPGLMASSPTFKLRRRTLRFQLSSKGGVVPDA